MNDPDRAYRTALGAYATGVAIVTAPSAPGIAAITINSFASVSLAPKLVLWSLGDQSDSYPVFSRAETFGISVLGAAHEEMARAYAKEGRSCASAGDVEMLADVAVLKGAIAALACRTFERRVLGDHLVIVGEVMDFVAREGAGLSFHRGRFGAIG